MKLQVVRKKSEADSGFLSNKKKSLYSIGIRSLLTDDEVQLLSKYGYMNESILLVELEELANLIIVERLVKGAIKFTPNELQGGLEWSCEGRIPTDFFNLPTFIGSQLKALLSVAFVKEFWGGEDTIEIDITFSSQEK